MIKLGAVRWMTVDGNVVIVVTKAPKKTLESEHEYWLSEHEYEIPLYES